MCGKLEEEDAPIEGAIVISLYFAALNFLIAKGVGINTWLSAAAGLASFGLVFAILMALLEKCPRKKTNDLDPA